MLNAIEPKPPWGGLGGGGGGVAPQSGGTKRWIPF